MITVIISLFFGASLVTSIALAAACMLSGQVQRAAEVELGWIPVESLHAIAEVELPNHSRRRQVKPAHAGI
jgi:hypothetical protein